MEDNMVLDTELDMPMTEIPKEKQSKSGRPRKEVSVTQRDSTVNCLRNERIIVRYVMRLSGLILNPNHILYGGMAENAAITYVVPKLKSGTFVNVLTDDEKTYLEECMGLEYNALSIYRKVDNFWDDSNPNGINRVRLTKQDNYFDLSNPQDYIKYKILLANKDDIAPSLEVLKKYPKQTYRFVIIAEGEETRLAKDNMSNTMKCYKEFGKIEDNISLLRMIVEILDGRPTAKNVKLDFLQSKCNDLIQADSKEFLRVITDPLLETKALIKEAIEEGLISQKGNYLYLREDGSPLCEQNEEPTLNFAAKYLNAPKRQDILFALQAKLNK